MIGKYTLCDISGNDGKNGKPVWIIIKGDVYDVTTFVKEVCLSGFSAKWKLLTYLHIYSILAEKI